MSNRSSSHQHCLVGKKFPSSKMRKRANKNKATLRRAERREAQQERLNKAKEALSA